MDPEEIARELARIEEQSDPCLRTLQLARLLSDLFSELGFQIIVTGGSAIELLTDGRYTSGDLDLRFESVRPPLRTIAEIMEVIGASGGTRTFRKGPLFVDILGSIETLANSPYRTIDGVLVAKPEDLLPERILMSIYPSPDQPSRLCAEKLLAAALSGDLAVDWDETERVAALPEYRVLDELRTLRAVVQKQLAEAP